MATTNRLMRHVLPLDLPSAGKRFVSKQQGRALPNGAAEGTFADSLPAPSVHVHGRSAT